MSEEKKMKVIVPPEVLAQMEEMMSHDELQEMLNEIQRLVDSGELFEQATPVNFDTLEEDDPETYAQMVEQMKREGFDNLDDWVNHRTDANPRTLN